MNRTRVVVEPVFFANNYANLPESKPTIRMTGA
jgi:hypothetical protein